MDDDPRLQEEYRLAFRGVAPEGASESYRSLEADLFSSGPVVSDRDMNFELTVRSQGGEAIAAVARATEAGAPYSVAFVDVRMPPGIDGVTAAERMTEIHHGLNVVIVTGIPTFLATKSTSASGTGRNSAEIADARVVGQFDERSS